MLRLMASGFPVEDVNRAYDDPPSSSEQILHPEKGDSNVYYHLRIRKVNPDAA